MCAQKCNNLSECIGFQYSNSNETDINNLGKCYLLNNTLIYNNDNIRSNNYNTNIYIKKKTKSNKNLDINSNNFDFLKDNDC